MNWIVYDWSEFGSIIIKLNWIELILVMGTDREKIKTRQFEIMAVVEDEEFGLDKPYING